MVSRRQLLGAGAGIAGCMLAPMVRAQVSAAGITATELRGLSLLQGAGANVVAFAGDDGALMIDGGLAANADALLAAVRAATGNDSVAMLVNTHWHPQQTGANVAVGSAGGTILAHENTRMYLSNTIYTQSILEERLAPLAEAGRPNEVTRGDGSFDFSGATVAYGYLPAAHTDGDLFVHFPERNVLVAGGVVAADHWPLLDYHNGAWFGGRVRALQRLAGMVDSDTVVIGADGPTLSGADIVRQRDIYLELFETMIGYLNKGYGPEDAAASAPLAAYDDEFGDASEFVYGALRSMLIAYVPD